MAKSKPTSWPKTPSGTTDWETVFEHPETGLIPIILKAPTPMALRECTRVVVENLHTKPDDDAEIKRFIAELKILVPDSTPAGTLPVVGDAVAKVLRNIKDERKEKAARFEAAQRDKTKRTPAKLTAPTKSRTGAKSTKASSRWPLALGGVGAVAVAAVAAYLIFGRDDTPEEAVPNLVLLDEIKRAARGEGPPTHVFGGALTLGQRAGHTMVTADKVPVDACMSVTWPLSNKGNIVIGNVMPRRVSLGVLRKLCSQSGATTTVIWIPRKPKK